MANKKTPVWSGPKGDKDHALWLQGVEQGKVEGKNEVLTFLQDLYMAPDLDISTPEAAAIIDIVKKIQGQFND